MVGFKCFLCPSGVEEFPNVEIDDLEQAFQALEGTGAVLAVSLKDTDLHTVIIINLSIGHSSLLYNIGTEMSMLID